jgi:hypothetical protein
MERWGLRYFCNSAGLHRAGESSYRDALKAADFAPEVNGDQFLRLLFPGRLA